MRHQVAQVVEHPAGAPDRHRGEVGEEEAAVAVQRLGPHARLQRLEHVRRRGRTRRSPSSRCCRCRRVRSCARCRGSSPRRAAASATSISGSPRSPITGAPSTSTRHPPTIRSACRLPGPELPPAGDAVPAVDPHRLADRVDLTGGEQVHARVQLVRDGVVDAAGVVPAVGADHRDPRGRRVVVRERLDHLHLVEDRHLGSAPRRRERDAEHARVPQRLDDADRGGSAARRSRRRRPRSSGRAPAPRRGSPTCVGVPHGPSLAGPTTARARMRGWTGPTRRDAGLLGEPLAGRGRRTATHRDPPHRRRARHRAPASGSRSRHARRSSRRWWCCATRARCTCSATPAAPTRSSGSSASIPRRSRSSSARPTSPAARRGPAASPRTRTATLYVAFGRHVHRLAADLQDGAHASSCPATVRTTAS